MNKKNYIKFFLFCFILRVPILIIYCDNGLQNECGPLVNNLIQNKTLAILNFGDFYLPNLWMPPIYMHISYIYYLFFLSLLIIITLILFLLFSV